MSIWGDELDIDDSDILGAYKRKEPLEPLSGASQPGPERVVSVPAIRSSSYLQHEVALGVLSRFQKPHRNVAAGSLHSSQIPSRHCPVDSTGAVPRLEEFESDPFRKRKRNFQRDVCSEVFPPRSHTSQPVLVNDVGTAGSFRKSMENLQASSGNFAIREVLSVEREPLGDPEEQGNRNATANSNDHEAINSGEASLHSLHCSPHPANLLLQKNSRIPETWTSRDQLEPISSRFSISADASPHVRMDNKENFAHPSQSARSETQVAQDHALGRERSKQRTENIQVRKAQPTATMRRTEACNRFSQGVLQRMELSHECRLNRNSLVHDETSLPDLHIGDSPPSHHTQPMPVQEGLVYKIPGPAGAVQMGLAHKRHPSSENNGVRPNNSVPCSRATEDDTDFKDKPWLAAMMHLEKIKGQGSLSTSTINSIKTSRTENKIPKLVAVIKTCTPNGCGDMFVNLKDRSDTIGGTIHRNVMTETEFGRDIEPGAVILLDQVAVFSPTPYAHYLNITVNNVNKVFRKGIQLSEEHLADAAIFKSKAGLTDVTGECHLDGDCQLKCVPSQLEHRPEELSAQCMHEKQSTFRGSLVMDNSSAVADVEVLNILSEHASVRGDVQQTIKGPVNVGMEGKQIHPGSQPSLQQKTFDVRTRTDKFCSAPVRPNDGYDQLLDDTDIFQCLIGRSSVL